MSAMGIKTITSPKFKLFLVLVYAALVLGPSGSLGVANEPRISREKAQEIATQYAISMKFNIESKDISIEWYDTPWNRWIRQDSTSEYDVPRLEKLSSHEYYAVAFSHRDRMTLGGPIVVFVDSRTGEVITFVAYR
jgi:hypothetical protein